MQINLDLRNLTPAHFEEAEAKQGRAGCHYTDPCIIGTLMTEEERQHNKHLGRDEMAVSVLPIEWPNASQATDARRLQKAFDGVANTLRSPDAVTLYERIKGEILARYSNQGDAT